MYNENIWRWYHDAGTQGAIESPSFCAKSVNAACGDQVTITGVTKNNIITNAKHQSSGCVISGAAASFLVSYALGRSISEMQGLTLDDVLAAMNLQLGPARRECIAVALKAFQDALAADTGVL